MEREVEIARLGARGDGVAEGADGPLYDGGYRIARVVPVDQFLYSPHVEMVAHLDR